MRRRSRADLRDQHNSKRNRELRLAVIDNPIFPMFMRESTRYKRRKVSLVSIS